MIEELFDNVDILTVRPSLSVLVGELLSAKASLEGLVKERDKLRRELLVRCCSLFLFNISTYYDLNVFLNI